MIEEMKLGIVLLAAGKSARFGANKLLADYMGAPMVCRAMDAAGELGADRAAVVTGSREIASLARARGFTVIDNHEPERGQAHSIHLGVSAMQDMDAVLLMVCDQPLLSAQSMERLIRSFACGEKGIACLRDGTHMGNPAVFGAAYFAQLLALAGDRGAKGVLRANEEDLLVVPAIGEDELSDADTPQALAAMRMQRHG